MTDRIIELLKESGADAWEVTDKVTEGWEFYFIGHELDQNRAKNVEHISVTVYRKLEDGKFLGSASEEINPTASDEEAKKVISDLCERATYVKNPYYELNREKVTADNRDYDIQKTARDYIEAMQQIPETSTEYVNSYEIFAEKCTRRFVNSEGIDVTVTFPTSKLEVIVNARNDEHEIELYRMYTSGTCDKEQIIREITDTLKFGKDRLLTKPTPNLNKATVLFSTRDSIKEIVNYLCIMTNASAKYRGFSNFEIGKDIVSDVTGDKFTVKGLKELPNSSNNTPVDSEGAAVSDMVFIKDNVPQNYWGDVQFRTYLGVKEGCIIGNYSAEGGSSSEADLRKGDYLEPVEFSDFSVDPISGCFASEIRLAYLHEGDKVTAVSGGSVTGNLNELLKNVKLSKEQKQYNNFLVPSVMKMENVTVAGSEA